MTDTHTDIRAALELLVEAVVSGTIPDIRDAIAAARAALAEPEPPRRNFVGGYQPRPSIGTHNPPPKNP